MFRFHLSGMLVGLLAISSAGCCCVQGVAPNGDCGIGACSNGSRGGSLMGFASCRGACGEVYVDEWISEPPTVDNCGYDCGGCGACGRCQPIRSALKLLWGRPFVANCSTDLCGPSCDGGCSTCGGGYSEDSEMVYENTVHRQSSSGCNCGQNHSTISSPQPIPYRMQSDLPNAPSVSPNATKPTPAPANPSTTKRLNPAQSRNIRQASAR